MAAKIIVVIKKEGFNEPQWWIADGNPFDNAPIRITESFDRFKEAFKEEFIEYINECSPWLLWFTEDGGTSGTSAKDREIIFDTDN